MRILLAGRISWRNLFPAACATGVLYVAMETVFSLFFSSMVISNDNKYGPIGFIFALLSYLTAIGVVVILGAVAGLAWYERSSGKSETGHLPLPSGTSRRMAYGGTVQDSWRPCGDRGLFLLASSASVQQRDSVCIMSVIMNRR
jgi:hypothetical protein